MKKTKAPKHPHHRPAERQRADFEIPLKTREATAELSRDYAQRLADGQRRREQATGEILQRGRCALREVISDKNRHAVLMRARQMRAQLRERMLPPGGPKLDYAAEFEEVKRKMKAFIRGLGISLEKQREVIRAVVADLKLVPVLHDEGEAWPGGPGSGVLAGIIDVLDQDPHRFVTFSPPFFSGRLGFAQNVDSDADTYWVDREVAFDSDAGLVGHKLTERDEGASDLDQLGGVADTQIEFWFKPPVAGLVEVIIEAQCGLGAHHFDASDEFGFSFAEVKQRNYLMMHVLHPNVTAPSFALMSEFDWSTDGIGVTKDFEFLTRGGDFVAQLFSDGPVTANQWIQVRAGTRSDDGILVNDMTVTSTSDFQWFLKNVHVRIAP